MNQPPEKFIKWNISLPPDLAEFVEAEVENAPYKTTRSAIIQAALEKARDRKKEDAEGARTITSVSVARSRK